jgi:gliding motility-associated-like protein
MKHTLLVNFILFFTLVFRTSVFAQTTIAFQGFEGTINDNWSFISPTQAAGAQPVLVGVSNYGVGYAHTGNNSCRAGGGSTDCGNGSSNCLNNASSGGACTNLANGAIIMFDTIDISCFSNVQIEVWHRSNAVCVGAGFDASDNLKFEVSLNGGAWTQVGLLSSANNYTWDYTVSLAGTSSTVANPYTYAVPSGVYTIAFRTNATVNRTDEVYYIDDVKLTGFPSSLSLPIVNVTQPLCSSPTGSIEIISPSYSGFTYSIDSINFNNTDGIFNNIVPGNSCFVQVQSPAGCTSPVLLVEIDSVISSSANASITALGPNVICNGDSVILQSAIGNASYQWFCNGTTILGANTVTYTAQNIGNYQVVVSDLTGCFDTSAVVTVTTGLANPPIINSTSGSLSICNGDSIILFSPNNYSTYQWLFDGNIIANAIDSSYTTSSSGSYQILVTDTNGCTDSSNVLNIAIANQNPAIINSTNGSFSICSNQQINLTVPQIYTSYQWYFNNVAIAGATNNFYTTTIAGNYYIITQSANGCYDTSATIQVDVFQAPIPIISPGSTIICTNEIAILETNSFISYQWNLNNTPIANENNANFITNQAGNYTVTVVDTNGCSGVSIAAIISIDSVNVSINANTQSYCAGDTALLIASGSNYNSLLWSTNFNGNSLQTNIPGNYTVVASNALGCTATASYNLIYSNQISIKAGASDTTLICDETIQLNVSGADAYIWEPATGLNDATVENPTVSGLTDFIIYTVTGKKGNCIAVDSIKIGYEACSSIFIPNAFSPNNDGANDVFRVLGNNIFDFNLKIYNRWGAIIFETNQVETGWDGKYNGKEVSSGVYVWVLNAKDANGRLINYNNKFSGNLTLFR